MARWHSESSAGPFRNPGTDSTHGSGWSNLSKRVLVSPQLILNQARSSGRRQQMNAKMTRRQLALLLSRAAVAGPALAWAAKFANAAETRPTADPSSPAGAPVYVV